MGRLTVSTQMTLDAVSDRIAGWFDRRVNPRSMESISELGPLISSPASVSVLETSTWTFGRQYAACYLGQLIGSCATVVNADGPKHAHPFP